MNGKLVKWEFCFKAPEFTVFLLKLGNVYGCPLGLIAIIRKATDMFWKKKVCDPDQPSRKLRCSDSSVAVCFM